MSGTSVAGLVELVFLAAHVLSMTNTYTDLDHPRIANGTFTDKFQSAPLVGLSYPESPSFDPNFFYDRVIHSADVKRVEIADLSEAEQALVRNAQQAVNDTWALEHGAFTTGGAADQYVESTVYREGANLVVDVQHKDQNETPLGSLIAFNDAGLMVGQFDNVEDSFGERWIPTAGLRAQLLKDLSEASADGSLGDSL